MVNSPHNIQTKGGGAKAFWTMFKKTVLFLREGFPNTVIWFGHVDNLFGAVHKWRHHPREGVGQKMTNDDMMTGGGVQQKMTIHVISQYTFFWTILGPLRNMLVDIYQEDSELGKIPSSQTSSIKVQGDFSNPFRFTIFWLHHLDPFAPFCSF